MSTLFWSRTGEPMDTIEWAKAYEDVAIRQVALDSDGTSTMVSTIWEGINKPSVNGLDEPVTTFETAVLVNGHIEHSWRSGTEEGATLLHSAACLKYLGRRPRPEDGYLRRRIEHDTGRPSNIKED